MKSTIAMVVVLVVSSMALVPPLSAAEQGKSIQIEKPWTRASIVKSRPAAAYMTIINHSGKADRLVSASSPVAGKVSVHLSEMTNGVMQMGPMHDLLLEPGEKVTLKPGGLHLMLMKLKAPLKKGNTLPLILIFETTGKIDVQAQIVGLGAFKLFSAIGILEFVLLIMPPIRI